MKTSACFSRVLPVINGASCPIIKANTIVGKIRIFAQYQCVHVADRSVIGLQAGTWIARPNFIVGNAQGFKKNLEVSF